MRGEEIEQNFIVAGIGFLNTRKLRPEVKTFTQVLLHLPLPF